jgi:serine/threonine protein kinase
MASQGYQEELLRHWFPTGEEQSELKPFGEKDIREISSILERAGKEAWSRMPRIYIILRLIGQLDAIGSFVHEEISDTWFPFTQRSLPNGLRDHSDRTSFLDKQRLVCNTKALNLERSDAGHGHFPDASEVPLRKVGELGKGGSGFVDRVVSTITHREYALKLIKRGQTFRRDKEVLRDFEKELSNLKRLSRRHKHIIDLIGSYTEPRYVGLLFPVADCNLFEFLAQTELDERRWSLRSYFGCLTSALGFLHDNKIRHKDIKPQNILIKDDEPYFTDFGVSVDWAQYGHSTTFGPTAMTPRYGAPEVAASEPRNSSSDIWSLGCVFLELYTVLRGATAKELTKFFTADGRLLPYHSKDADVSAWIDRIRKLPGSNSDNLPSVWIEQMLKRERGDRWSTYLLLESIRESSADLSAQYLYIGRCCLDDEETSESVTSDTSEETQDVTIKASNTNRDQPPSHMASDPKSSVPPPVEATTNGRDVSTIPLAVPRTGTDKHRAAPLATPDSLEATTIRLPNQQAAESGISTTDQHETKLTERADDKEEQPRGDVEGQSSMEPQEKEQTRKTSYHYPALTSWYPIYTPENMFRYERAGVVHDPGKRWTEIEKHMLYRDTINRLGFVFAETRDYFYIYKCLDDVRILYRYARCVKC